MTILIEVRTFLIGLLWGMCFGVLGEPFAHADAMKTNMDSSNRDLSQKELIVLATPPPGDQYYADMRDTIFDFHVAYARQILKQDDVIVFAASDVYADYVDALGEKHVASIAMQDIWMRDFSPVNPDAPVMMRYSAAGQGGDRRGQSEADFVQDQLVDIINKAGLNIGESDGINDGGNFVEDGAGRAILSRKFLRDNGLSETAARKAIQKTIGVDYVAFIEADEQGGLEHADGVVAFIDPNTVVINQYPEDDPAFGPYARALKADLRRGLPGVKIHEIITPYDGSQIYDARFGSACGLYTNMLVTPHHIYLPEFGISADQEALTDLRRWTQKTVTPVMSDKICKMGGGVRCMSWQLRGIQARAMRKYVRATLGKTRRLQ